MRRRLAAPVLAASLLVGAALFPTAALADRLAIGFNVVCVYYTETAGTCVSETMWSDGTSEFHWYVFWGNWYAEV